MVTFSRHPVWCPEEGIDVLRFCLPLRDCGAVAMNFLELLTFRSQRPDGVQTLGAPVGGEVFTLILSYALEMSTAALFVLVPSLSHRLDGLPSNNRGVAERALAERNAVWV